MHSTLSLLSLAMASLVALLVMLPWRPLATRPLLGGGVFMVLLCVAMVLGWRSETSDGIRVMGLAAVWLVSGIVVMVVELVRRSHDIVQRHRDIGRNYPSVRYIP